MATCSQCSRTSQSSLLRNDVCRFFFPDLTTKEWRVKNKELLPDILKHNMTITAEVWNRQRNNAFARKNNVLTKFYNRERKSSSATQGGESRSSTDSVQPSMRGGGSSSAAAPRQF